MEIRTKSSNLKSLVNLKPSSNVEIAFSLNPQEIIKKYELLTTWLDMRIKSINTLVDLWWNVWIRFLPLLEINNYKEVYSIFLNDIIHRIDFDKIYSVFIWWLLYTKSDYNKMLDKEPYLDVLYKLEDSSDWFYREKREVRDFFYSLFNNLIKSNECNICLDN